jgi:hypothetical protein
VGASGWRSNQFATTQPAIAPLPHEVASSEPGIVAKEKPSPSRQIAGSPTVPEPLPTPDARAAGPENEAPPLVQRIAALIPTQAPRYAPGVLASGPLVRIGGAGRGNGENAPHPVALGPAHIGLTSREAPSLYWFLPAPTALPVAVSIVSDAAPAPLLELTLPGPHAVGVHAVSLEENDVRLAPGVDYEWFAAVVSDPERRSRDLVARAAIRFAPPSVEIAERLAESPERRAHVYAEAGLWYDAYDQLSRWLAAEPDAAILRAHRAALLEQVGLASAAASELSAAPASVPAP